MWSSCNIFRLFIVPSLLLIAAFSSSANLQNPDVAKLLEGLGYTVEAKKSDAGNDYWRVKAEGAKYSYSIDVIYSVDKSILYLTTYFKDISTPDKIPAAALLALLKANDDNTPMSFGFVEKQKRFVLSYPLGSQDISPAKLKKAFSDMTKLADATASFWDPDLWGKE